jgi:hypothetical protein
MHMIARLKSQGGIVLLAGTLWLAAMVVRDRPATSI